jgi:hypothetical protein
MHDIKHDIELDSIFVDQTYAGCYAGCPTPEHMIESAKRQATKLFGEDRPTLVLEPEIDVRDYEETEYFSNKHLPNWRTIAWFTSQNGVKERDAHGSHIILIWYSKDLPQALDHKAVLDRFSWTEHAGDFWY